MDGLPDLLEFHQRQLDAGEHDAARATLALALQTARYRAPALVNVGLAALQGQRPESAFLALSEAVRSLPKQASLVALLGRAVLDQRQPALAVRLLDAAWVRHAGDPNLRITQWMARMAGQTPQQTVAQIHAAWSYMDEAERRFASQQLRRVGAPVPGEAATAPVVGDGAVKAAATALSLPGAPVSATAPLGPESVVPEVSAAGPATASAPVPAAPPAPPPTLAAAPTHVTASGQGVAAAQRAASPAPRAAVRPGHRPAPASTARPVDVLIPVYNGGMAVPACLRSVLRAARANRTPHRVIVLDDASTDRALQVLLRDLAKAGQIHLIRQPVNLGFIGNINHGMGLNPTHDVVWLNADTRVHGNWLDRLRAAAYANKATATATPFSNNGELLSFPHMLRRADMPDDAELALLDTAAQTLSAKPVEIEMGCGFCFFIKRAALDAVGLLDGEHLKRGYGEETDWCLRARALGWQHVAATNVFVAHQGGVSFGDEKALRVLHNNAILRRRYPEAEARFHRFVRMDPLYPARQALQHARLKTVGARLRTGPATDRRLRVADPRRALLHLPDDTAPLRLYWRLKNQTEIQATLVASAGTLPVELDYALPRQTDRLRADLKTLGVNGIGFTDTQNTPEPLTALAAALKLPRTAWAQAWPPAQPAATGPVTAVLVADAPGNAELADRWLALARRWARQPQPGPLLLLAPTSPWWPALQATGIVRALPEVDGLTLQQCLALSGCTAAVSLEVAPDASWLAPHLAAHVGLPLYAPASDTAQDASAHPLSDLALPTGWPLAA